jgi:hypothetical protein
MKRCKRGLNKTLVVSFPERDIAKRKVVTEAIPAEAVLVN